jgi:hypothetical protein
MFFFEPPPPPPPGGPIMRGSSHQIKNGDGPFASLGHHDNPLQQQIHPDVLLVLSDSPPV